MNCKSIIIPLLVAVSLFMYSCDIISSSKSGNTSVDVQFKVKQSTQSTTQSTVQSSSSLLDDTLNFGGSNGTLTITDVRFIVSEFEIERVDGECVSDTAESDTASAETEEKENEECEEIEGGPTFVDLPLDGSAVNAVTGSIQPGDYDGMEFEVENIDFEEEEEDDEEQQRRQAVIDTIKKKFPNWPEEASMVVQGQFTPSDSDSGRNFQAYVEAEIEVEKSFDPPLAVTENSVPRDLKINITPDVWFKRSDGTVRDLSDYDYSETGRILELEVELENGFSEIEIGEDRKDDEEDEDDN